MLIKNFFRLIFPTVILIALVNSGCNKENKEASLDEEVTTVQDNTTAEKIFGDVSDIADEAHDSKSITKSGSDEDGFIGNCATITFDTLEFPKTITIDFGDTNCLCPDGRYRRGKILVSFTGPYREEGTVITHTFDNYFVNDNQVLGSKIVTNEGYNENDHLYFTIDIDGQIIKANGGGTITWVSNRIREWIEGEETYDRFDDVYLITGEGSGTTASGYSFTEIITQPLRRELSCKFFVSGTFEFTPENKPVRILDYGDGTCDNIATVTVNGKTHTIYLH
jgi:hypothetical protein